MKVKNVVLLIIIIMLITGCASQTPKEKDAQGGAVADQDELIWDEWDSLKEAEAAVGFDFELPETVSGSYKAEEYKTLNGEIIEVTYRDDDYTVYVRKQKIASSLWADLPGGYNETDFEVRDSFDLDDGTITYSYNPEDENSPFKTDILYKGFCWALFAPKGYWGDSAYDFSTGIYEPHIQIDPERVERIQVTTQITEHQKDVVVEGEQLEELIYKLNSYKVNATDKEMGEGWQYMFTIEYDGNEKQVITFMNDMVAFYEDTNLVEAAVYIVEEYSPNDFLYLFE